MDNIIPALVELIPLAKWLEKIVCNEKISLALASVIIFLILIGILALFKKLRIRSKNRKTERNLKPQFDYKSIKLATQFYIPTQYQNVSPTKEDEPKFTQEFVSRSKLIPFFLKVAFSEKLDSEKFYLILADSGMGKTTFMVNLYMKYTAFFNRQREKEVKMKLFRLGVDATLDLIKKIKREEAKNTILLLDALDEDPFILPQNSNMAEEEVFRNRVDEIITATKNFRKVVFTCRTQYFPGQEVDPYELKIKKPDKTGYYTLNKLYISPFNNTEVKWYLNKKYPLWKLWKRKQKKQAMRIAKNSPELSVRPMLLSYIDLLVQENKEFKTVFEIYDTLIEKWLVREAKKRKPKKEREVFIKNLRKLSQQTAVTIYQERNKNKGLVLNKEQVVTIAHDNYIELKPDEVTGKSLLTCDGQGNWNFVHKSIFEFFLAKEAVENIDFFHEIAKKSFAGIDKAESFYQEIGDWNFVKGGTFNMGEEHRDSGSFGGSVQVTVTGFYIGKTPVTQKQWRDVMGCDPEKLRLKNRDSHPVNSVSWNNVQDFIKKLQAQTGKTFRLPTEVEWEYAAKGGFKSKGYKYAGSNNFDEVGWYNKNSKNSTRPVAQKKANELGIYDMSGNVWEWCQDKWHNSYEGVPTDGSAWETGESLLRVLRGGSWRDDARNCRTTFRGNIFSDIRDNDIGFRLVFVL